METLLHVKDRLRSGKVRVLIYKGSEDYTREHACALTYLSYFSAHVVCLCKGATTQSLLSKRERGILSTSPPGSRIIPTN